MPSAIRIDKQEVISNGNCHLDLMRAYQTREGLTDDQLDALIDEGRLEFGDTYWNSQEKKLCWMGDEVKDEFYTSVADVVSNARDY